MTVFVKLSILDICESLDALYTLLYGNDMLQRFPF